MNECDIPEQYDFSRSDCPFRSGTNGSICSLDGESCSFGPLKEV